MKRLRELTIEPLPKAEDIRRPFDIDHYSQRVAKLPVVLLKSGILTFMRTEYPDLNFIHEELLDTSSLEYLLHTSMDRLYQKQDPFTIKHLSKSM